MQLLESHSVTVAMSCAIVGLSRCAYYYQPKLLDDSVIISVLDAITVRHLRWGFPNCFNRFRKLGYQWIHKCVYRVYCELMLNLKVKGKQRIPPRTPEKLSVPNKSGECWSMDFMRDSSRNQRRFRTFNVIDDFNREALGIDIAVSLPAGRVTRYLGNLAEYDGYPLTIRVVNGPEFTGKTFIDWAKSHGITIDYIKPGSPYQNGYIERFNRTYRTEVLDLYLFNNLEQARRITEEWLTIYNTERPHEALNNMTPFEY
ncbi:IS3 family transposase [Snodgrassella communis]|uniref:IS3 family transposase n=1 Tax=Snodgrassella communis TaxID=2946699 RepID=UPI00286BD28D|nr:IS3 family transposase [Snodgrassella communis]WMY91552.1 IS3 family transposase [Snodgrassella communis]